MLYYLFDYLQEVYNFPGAGVFQYISFRSAMAVITSLLVSMVFGGRIINLIRRKQIGEEVREVREFEDKFIVENSHTLKNVIIEAIRNF